MTRDTPSAALHILRGVTPHRTNLRIVKTERAIRELSPQIADLLEQTGQAGDVTLAPEYFLRNNALRCAPLVVLISEGEQIVAALYGRERRILGIRTGMVQFGDYYGEGSVIAMDPFKAAAVSWAALNVLQHPRIHWVRASFKPSHPNDISTVESAVENGRVKARLLPETVQHILPLKASFEGFLSTLGSHTRRNLRVYRRRVEQKGWRFVPGLGPTEVAAAFASLKRQQGRHQSSEHYLNCCRDTLEAVAGSFYAGIRTEAGEWVSLAAGWLHADTYFMLVQLNDSRYKRDSISTVMRSYLIEHVIGHGAKTINFVGGSSELLGQFCTPQTCAHYLFESNGALSGVRDVIALRLFGNSMVSRIVRKDTSQPHTTVNDPAQIGCLVPLQTKGSEVPLYAVHDIHGEIRFYRPLAECLAPERPVFGVQVPNDLTQRAKSWSIELLAAGYIKEILDRQATGPFHLVGFSTGSVVAFEMARQLIEKGHKVGMLALIDGDINCPGPASSKAERYRKIAVRKACRIAFKFTDELKAGPKQFVAKRLRYLWLRWSVKQLQKRPQLEDIPTCTIEQALALAEMGYRPQRLPGLPGPAILIRFHDEAWNFGPDPLMGWRNLLEAGIETVDFPGSHTTGMGATNAPKLASLLTANMKKREAAVVPESAGMGR